MSPLFQKFEQPGTLSFKDVSVSRGVHMLFTGLSFDLTFGQVLWVHGDNGIGKTTLLRIAAGFTPPETGTVKWSNGETCSPADVIAYQGHQAAFKAALTAHEALEFWADVYDFDGSLSTIFAAIGLSDKKTVRTAKLSAGQQRRLGLARLIMSRKSIWIMDEPAASMDGDGRHLTENMITRHIARGGSVLIASHSPAKSLGQNARRLMLGVAS